MIKRNKGILILTTAVILLPVIVGLFLWNEMPEQVPIHWNAAGEVDDWGSRGMVVFGLPMFILGVHWICVLCTAVDSKSWDVHSKVLRLVLWICPSISLLISTFVYASSLGYDMSIEIIMPLILGLLFLIIGNYMPKCTQNRTIGIRVPWTLNNEENWNRTHRFAGRLWVIGGAVIMATSVLGNFVVFFGVTIAITAIPIVYSYLYHRRQKKENH